MNFEKLQVWQRAARLSAELRTQIYIGMDIGYLAHDSGKLWLEETREISAMLNGLITRVNS